jgi:hypothetical protein
MDKFGQALIADNMFGEWHASYTLQTSFIDFEKEISISCNNCPKITINL